MALAMWAWKADGERWLVVLKQGEPDYAIRHGSPRMEAWRDSFVRWAKLRNPGGLQYTVRAGR